MIHIGSKIREIQRNSGLTVVAFAKGIPCSRRNAYAIFTKSSIDTNLMMRISRLLKHDFFQYFSTAYQGSQQARSVLNHEDYQKINKLEKAIADQKKICEELMEEVRKLKEG